MLELPRFNFCLADGFSFQIKYLIKISFGTTYTLVSICPLFKIKIKIIIKKINTLTSKKYIDIQIFFAFKSLLH